MNYLIVVFLLVSSMTTQPPFIFCQVLYMISPPIRLNFHRSLVSGLRPSPREERRLFSRTGAGDRACSPQLAHKNIQQTHLPGFITIFLMLCSSVEHECLTTFFPSFPTFYKMFIALFFFVLSKDSWKMCHRWQLPVAYYYQSTYHFRLVLSPTIGNVTCHTLSQPTGPRLQDFYFHFIRKCNT